MRLVIVAIISLFVAAACGGAAAPSASAAAAPTVKTADDAKLGKILVAANGMTLYTYDKDTANTSTCTGACASNWPALTIASGTPVGAGITGTLGTAASNQVTWNSKPLYFYAKDTKPGDTTGDKVGNVWHVITNP